MVKLEQVTESLQLGEAPHWDSTTKSLYLVDIFDKKILRYSPQTKKVTQASFEPYSPTFIIPIEGKKEQFVVSADNELHIISWDGESDKYKFIEKITTVERTKQAPNLAFNDAKCDSSGRLWAGTHSLGSEIPNTEPLGTLYTLNNKKLQAQLSGIKIANGLAFNDETKKMFYIDSLLKRVDRFDFDITEGKISNREVWFTLEKSNIPGMPDGMAIDTDGHLWVAIFGGNKLLKVDGHKKETLLQSIELPAEQVTSVAFGGHNLDELYVTTGRLIIAGKQLTVPENGATYRITGTGSRGLPGSNLKLI